MLIKYVFLIIAAVYVITGCSIDSFNPAEPEEPAEPVVIRPVINASQISGRWSFGELEFNGKNLMRGFNPIKGPLDSDYTLSRWGGEGLMITPASELSGTFNISEFAAVANLYAIFLIRTDTLVVEGTFNIPKPGVLEIVLTSSRNENPRYLGKTYRGLILLENEKLLIDFDQSTFSNGDKTLRPTYGYNFVDNERFSSKFRGRFTR